MYGSDLTAVDYQ